MKGRIKKEIVAMILAGGQGSRLMALTEKNAKPAVQIGGKYRIIDFTLSNCINSRIDTVGVLTQYQPLFLNEYIGNGYPWDLDRNFGGVHILPPYQGKRCDFYKGTANAVYQNKAFIERYSPEYVIILSGDHIYKMDYSRMLDFHKERSANCTVAAIKVADSEASRFGILSCDPSGRITDFEEKPKVPKSNLASMGIYIFSTDYLFECLEKDDKNEHSSKDFGKNVLPDILALGGRLFAYPAAGYWKDVGTISSFWEANMDLIGHNDLTGDASWRIFSRNYARPPQYIGKTALVSNSIITEGCKIYGSVKNSVLSGGVVIEEGAEVCDCVIMSDTRICRGAKVTRAVVDSDSIIGEEEVVGGTKSIAVISPNNQPRKG